MAVSLRSPVIDTLRDWTKRYQTALLTGYIERDGEKLYSSCVLIDNGEILHNYRRVTKGWKEYTKTNDHYREGDSIREILFRERSIQLALCGDLWDEGWERFRTESLLIWPVYVDFSVEEWEKEEIEAYAAQASLIAKDVLMVNSLCDDPRNDGGAFHFHEGRVIARLPFSEEGILIADI